VYFAGDGFAKGRNFLASRIEFASESSAREMPVITPRRRNGESRVLIRITKLSDDFPRLRGTGFNRALIGARAACKPFLKIARCFDCRVKSYVKVGRA